MTNNDQNEPTALPEETNLQVQMREAEKEWEAEATRVYGPPEVRLRKNQRYISRLVQRYSEPLIRGLLTALSTLDQPSCAHWLYEHDLVNAPLETIIQPLSLEAVASVSSHPLTTITPSKSPLDMERQEEVDVLWSGTKTANSGSQMNSDNGFTN